MLGNKKRFKNYTKLYQIILMDRDDKCMYYNFDQTKNKKSFNPTKIIYGGISI